MFLIDQTICTGCGGCAAVCPALAITIGDKGGAIDEKCTNCRVCALFCPVSAINPDTKKSMETLP